MNMPPLASSAVWTAVTVACYLAGLGVRRATRGSALANPALVAILLLLVLLRLTRTPYADYFHATRMITFLLAPATVALGVPLERNFLHVRRNLHGVGLGLLAGGLSSMLSGVVLVRMLGGSQELARCMLPKAATTPIAIGVAQQIGAQPGLTAVLAILGGIIAAVTLRGVLGICRIHHDHAAGLAAGTAGSGIGAAQAALRGDAAAAFGALGIGLNGLLTALAAPAVARFLG